MIFSFLVFSFISLLIVQGQDVSFKTEALAKKTKCSKLTRSECLVYHEAFTECADLCQEKIKGPDDTGKSDDPDSGKKKPSGDSEGKRGGAGCFHGDELVMTNFGMQKMSDLPQKTDLQILTQNTDGKLTFSALKYWMHRDADRITDFITLVTKSGQNLTLTPDHLIYETNCDGKNKIRPIFSEKVQLGSCVLVQNGGQVVETKVTEKFTSLKRGVYAPITENGNLIVNGILASSFCCVENEQVQKLIFGYVDLLANIMTSLMPQNWLASFSESSTGRSTPLELVFWVWDVSKSFIL